MTETMSKAGTGSARLFACAKVSEVLEGSMIGVSVAGRQVLVGRVGGQFYAMDAVCSHLSGYLPKGQMDRNIVICPVHKAQFDVVTGRVLKNVGMSIKLATHREATDLMTYETKVVGEDVFVLMDH